MRGGNTEKHEKKKINIKISAEEKHAEGIKENGSS